jgi:NodT family efflux transporter outer membrane factor (OMF) lipoprotein
MILPRKSPVRRTAHEFRLSMPHRAGLLAGSLVFAGVLSGCAAVPKLGEQPALASTGMLHAETIAAGAHGQWPGQEWWRDLGDQQLDQLIDEALSASPTLAAAQARVLRAQGAAQTAGAALLPSLDANAQAAEAKQSYNNGIPAQFVPKGWNDTGRASVDLSYQIDFFGRNRSALRAATSERIAADVEARAARLSLATSVAAAYADLGRTAANRALRAEALTLREQTANLVQQRVANGFDTRAEQRQADAALAAARGDLSATDEALALARNSIAALLGAGPDRGATIAPPALPRLMPVELPRSLAAELVGRRADIEAARLRTSAAAERIKVARAGFYPNVNLMAFIGVQSLGLGNLTAAGSGIGQAGAAISLPIFDGGRLQGNYRIARADYDEAVAQYNETLVRALREVADATASQQAVGAQLSETQAAVTASQEAFTVAQARYKGGLSNFLAVLSAQDALLRNRQLLVGLQARTVVANLDLIRALGGGFHAE